MNSGTVNHFILFSVLNRDRSTPEPFSDLFIRSLSVDSCFPWFGFIFLLTALWTSSYWVGKKPWINCNRRVSFKLVCTHWEHKDKNRTSNSLHSSTHPIKRVNCTHVKQSIFVFHFCWASFSFSLFRYQTEMKKNLCTRSQPTHTHNTHIFIIFWAPIFRSSYLFLSLCIACTPLFFRSYILEIVLTMQLNERKKNKQLINTQHLIIHKVHIIYIFSHSRRSLYLFCCWFFFIVCMRTSAHYIYFFRWAGFYSTCFSSCSNAAILLIPSKWWYFVVDNG